jgi:hypothetical protein
LDAKIFDNWIKQGKEISFIKFKNRNGFDDDQLQEWSIRINDSLVLLGRNDYLECFAFAIEAYYSSMTRADFNRGKQRDVGEFLTNQIQGKLGEIAVKKQIEKQRVYINLDFSVTGQIPSQDITQISVRRNVWNNPAIKVSIKSTKLKNILLAIPQNEAELADRRSDMYILSQVGLFPDHILRIIKTIDPIFLGTNLHLIPDFGPIPARIAGWISHPDLVAGGPMSVEAITEHFGIKMAAKNYIRVTGELSTNWGEMCHLIVG